MVIALGRQKGREDRKKKTGQARSMCNSFSIRASLRGQQDFVNHIDHSVGGFY